MNLVRIFADSNGLRFDVRPIRHATRSADSARDTGQIKSIPKSKAASGNGGRFFIPGFEINFAPHKDNGGNCFRNNNHAVDDAWR